MLVRLPSVGFEKPRQGLAPRPSSLDGKILAFVDGWGHPRQDGSTDMYPLMAELKETLSAQFRLADVKWFRKPNASQPLPPELFQQVLESADIVINGEAL